MLTFPTPQALREAFEQYPLARAMVGTLREGAWAVDVDPADTGADPVFGDACAEALRRWAEEHGLELVIRESGRPGGRHLVLVDVDQDLVDELRQVAAELAAGLTVRVTVRPSLRLLESPHRLGLPAPVLYSNVTVPQVFGKASRRKTVTLSSASGEERSAWSDRVSVASGGAGDGSDSGREFGRAMQRARAGATALQAFDGALDCQVVRRGGIDEWRHYIWSGVVTTLAAELGQDEDQAWAWFAADCPSRAAELGRDGWRPRWIDAQRQAADVDRPRRFRPYDPTAETGRDQGEQADVTARRTGRADEVELLREVLHQAAEQLVAHRRPQVVRSMSAVLDAYAEALATTGRISVRRLAEAAQVADSTAELRRIELLGAGVLRRTATYKDDGQTCDLYTLGPAAMPLRERLEKTRGRSCTPPRPRHRGTANPTKLRARHQAQRAANRPRTLTSAHTEKIKATYPKGTGHGPAIISSRLRQRAWWRSLTETQQDERLELVRARNDALSPDDRDRWIGWLSARTSIDEAIDHVLDGTATAADRAELDAAPMTVHHGRRDPLWRAGGTRPASTSNVGQRAVQLAFGTTAAGEPAQLQLDLVAAAANAP